VICFDEGEEKMFVVGCNCSAESFNIVLQIIIAVIITAIINICIIYPSCT